METIASQLTRRDTVTFEMTTNSFAIVRLFKEKCQAKVIVSNPMKTRLIASARVKTDKIDARVLCELARVSFLLEVWLPDEATESLRECSSLAAPISSAAVPPSRTMSIRSFTATR